MGAFLGSNVFSRLQITSNLFNDQGQPLGSTWRWNEEGGRRGGTSGQKVPVGLCVNWNGRKCQEAMERQKPRNVDLKEPQKTKRPQYQGAKDDCRARVHHHRDAWSEPGV